MSLTFPLSLPQAGLPANAFELLRADYLAPEISGRVGAVAGAFPLWELRAALGGMTAETADYWRAFVTALRGPQRLFYGSDQTRPFPREHPNGFAGLVRPGGGGVPFDGTATSWSVNADRDVVVLNGIATPIELRWGDYAMWKWTTGGQPRRSLHRLVESGYANSSGIVNGVTMEPPLPSFVPAGAVVDLANPVCLMRLTPETRLGAVDLHGQVSGDIHAIQVLLP